MKKLSLVTAYQAHYDMWNLLSQTGELKPLNGYVNNCSACQYNEDRPGNKHCEENCIIKWPKSKGCLAKDSPYVKWNEAETMEERKYWAGVIRDLPHRNPEEKIMKIVEIEVEPVMIRSELMYQITKLEGVDPQTLPKQYTNDRLSVYLHKGTLKCGVKKYKSDEGSWYQKGNILKPEQWRIMRMNLKYGEGLLEGILQKERKKYKNAEKQAFEVKVPAFEVKVPAKTKKTTVVRIELEKVLNSRSELRYQITKLEGCSPEVLPREYAHHAETVYLNNGTLKMYTGWMLGKIPAVGVLLRPTEADELFRHILKGEEILKQILKEERKKYENAPDFRALAAKAKLRAVSGGELP